VSSWHEPRREAPLRGFILIACAVPVLFFGLDALLLWIAGLVQ
jgi:uncharacterized membrane protein